MHIIQRTTYFQFIFSNGQRGLYRTCRRLRNKDSNVLCVCTEWCKLPDEGVWVAWQPATWKPRDKAPKHKHTSSNWPPGLPEVMVSGLTKVQPPAASTCNFLVAGRPWFQTLRCCQTSPRDNSIQCWHHPPRFTVYSKSEAKRLGASIGQRAMY